MKELLAKPAIGLALLTGASETPANAFETPPVAKNRLHHVLRCMERASVISTQGIDGRALIFKSPRQVTATIQPQSIDLYTKDGDRTCEDVPMRRYERIQVRKGKLALSRNVMLFGVATNDQRVTRTIDTYARVKPDDHTIVGRFVTIVKSDETDRVYRAVADVPIQAQPGQQDPNNPYPNCAENGYETGPGYCITP
jgi:hypothetical protein